ncbi:hypothetical protein SISSUDRAFT_1068593 [Sistotremastrum suecicum HHB10207 ss-3]|uniref:U3-containing 90S pre-ribosomal complex subunit-domain containing protein n=1 Tax=Sistotremastrum suecicum HHB10207 ss-3 TaxID=1314776 RepID=A0A166IX88_9AGAM|nr:hypothetical protein SISSUDRAFT_1068593 [Sistotremastrum suecicum HHB10207 ss-3]
MQHGGGDDLDDDFVPDDLVALSDGGEELDSASLESWTGVELDDQDGGEPSDQTQLKKRKRREKEKDKKAKKRKLAESNVVITPASVASQPPEALSEYLAQTHVKACPKLSSIELDELRIPAEWIADTSAWSTAPRTLDILPEFIGKVLPSLKTRLGQRPKNPGAPTLLFITGAALRVVDVVRILKAMKGSNPKAGDIAKLFAKHVKIEEQVHYLKRTKVGAAAGTPGRIGKLINDTDALSLSALSHIILDTSYVDKKNRSMFEIPETRQEVFQLVLDTKPIRDALASGKTSLVLF